MYQANVPLENLTPGKYSLQATASTETEDLPGQIVNFYLSYPMYVAWTIDWEGYDENDTNLEALASISSEYEVPLTHFLHPRIYIAEEVSEERADYLSAWIRSRLEPVGLHLHMQKDYVKAAGVEPKEAPRWAKFKENDGYDIPTSEYSYEEIKKMVKYGVDLIRSNGLGTPTMYRAGGWFANKDVLQALEDLNFKLDSSGRKPENWWSGYSNIWNLEETTQPYKPSKENQNLSFKPAYNFFEFPNNGGDSTSYDTSELIDKFDANFDEGPLEEKRIVTYISHPRWFDVDGPKMKEVFKYINNFSYTEDAGPVVYITLEEALNVWSK